MSWWNRITSLASRTYNDFANGIKTVWNPIRDVVKTAASWIHKADDFIGGFAKNIPVVGEIVNLVRDNPLYKEILGTVDTVNNAMDVAESVGSNVDKLIRENLLGQSPSPGGMSSQRFPQDGALKQPPQYMIPQVSATM